MGCPRMTSGSFVMSSSVTVEVVAAPNWDFVDHVPIDEQIGTTAAVSTAAVMSGNRVGDPSPISALEATTPTAVHHLS
jgi:hypothetical protein